MLKHKPYALGVILLVMALCTPAALATSSDTKSIVGSGGFSMGLWYPNFSELNALMPEAEFSQPVVLFGGGGSGVTVPGWGFGGFGGGSSQTNKNAELSVGLGGGFVRRTFQLGKGYWFLGGMLGGGGADLYISNSEGISTVEEAINNSGSINLTTGFFAAAPQVGVEIPVTEALRIQATAGYMNTFGGNWRQRGGSELSGGKVDWNGPFFQIGIKFGGHSPASR